MPLMPVVALYEQTKSSNQKATRTMIDANLRPKNFLTPLHHFYSKSMEEPNCSWLGNCTQKFVSVVVFGDFEQGYLVLLIHRGGAVQCYYSLDIVTNLARDSHRSIENLFELYS